MFSFFDKRFHPFECSNPNCRHRFHGLSRWLIHANEVVCPKCGTRKTIDLNHQTSSQPCGQHGSPILLKRVYDDKGAPLAHAAPSPILSTERCEHYEAAKPPMTQTYAPN